AALTRFVIRGLGDLLRARCELSLNATCWGMVGKLDRSRARRQRTTADSHPDAHRFLHCQLDCQRPRERKLAMTQRCQIILEYQNLDIRRLELHCQLSPWRPRWLLELLLAE